MYDFIVLGLVPGTNVQITFEMFAFCVSLLALILTVLYLTYQLHMLRQLIKFTLMTGEFSHKLLINWQNALPPKLQFFK